jgi:CDP-diacylglycerol--glycerol-3-phosphate 3-phosphatidyltransferase
VTSPAPASAPRPPHRTAPPGGPASRRRAAVIAFTAARIPLAAAAAVLLAHAAAASPAAWAALLLILAAETTDMLDGLLARRLGVAGRFGELFDPYCDSVSRLVAYSGLAWAGLCPWWVVLVMAVRDVSVSYVRILCMHQGRQVAARASGKLKAIVQGAAAVGLALTLAVGAWARADGIESVRLAVAWLVATVTAWSAGDYFAAAVRRRAPRG